MFGIWTGLTEEQIHGFTKLMEENYRRGYHHGFIFSRNSEETTEQQVRAWRYEDFDPEKKDLPPGTPEQTVKFRQGVAQMFKELREKGV